MFGSFNFRWFRYSGTFELSEEKVLSPSAPGVTLVSISPTGASQFVQTNGNHFDPIALLHYKANVSAFVQLNVGIYVCQSSSSHTKYFIDARCLLGHQVVMHYSFETAYSL
jgi:hypothetical protein